MSAHPLNSSSKPIPKFMDMMYCWYAILLQVLFHAGVDGKSDWSLEYDPADPMQTAIIAVTVILIFIGIIFLIFIIITLCTPARRKRREQRRHCQKHCRTGPGAASQTPSQGQQSQHHPKDPRSPGPPQARQDFHEVVVPHLRNSGPTDVPHVVVEDNRETAPAGYAEKYRIPVHIKPRFSREEMMSAIADSSSESTPALPVSESDSSSSAGSSSIVPLSPAGRVRSISEVYKQHPEMAKRLERDNESVASTETQIRFRSESPSGSSQ
jgi:hypothetical protein